MKKTLILLCSVLVLVVCAFPAMADDVDDFDYCLFATNEVLTAWHPTANPENATAVFDQEPTTLPDNITMARVRVSYKGWVTEHELLAEIRLMKTAAGTLVHADVLQDTNIVNIDKVKKPALATGWINLADIGWK